MSDAKCLRCGAGSEWIKGKVPNEQPKSSFAGSVNTWLDKELGQIGIYMRQSGEHKNMVAYLKALREEISMTETFLSEDGYSPNDKVSDPATR